jgi:hypothetical protein
MSIMSSAAEPARVNPNCAITPNAGPCARNACAELWVESACGYRKRKWLVCDRTVGPRLASHESSEPGYLPAPHRGGLFSLFNYQLHY